MNHRITLLFLTQTLLSGHGVFARLNENMKISDDDTAGKLIVGGEPTVPGRYPYQVGLTNGDGFPGCGGSLIDSQWILSAAHCAGLFSHVEIGRYDFSDNSETFETIEIAFEMKHPNYNGRTLDNDFMVIRLKEPSSYAAVKLDDGSSDLSAGTDVTVMGWGATSERLSSDVLLEVEVDVVSGSECNSISAYNGDVNEDVMICAAREGKDSCQGDSGGPLIIKGEDETSDIQVGIVSWGNGCAQANYPGVYARVDSGLDFIESYQTCSFESGTDDSSFGECCNVLCENGVFTCQRRFKRLFSLFGFFN